MARIASVSRVCNQQQGTFNNQVVSIHSKLWKRNENGSRLEKERKDGKGNGICGENEKDTGRSRSGIEKGIRGNEETSR